MKGIFPARKSVPRINTVVEIAHESDVSDDEDDVSEISRQIRPPSVGGPGSTAAQNAVGVVKTKQIAIELNVSSTPDGVDGYVDVNSVSLDSNFLSGAGILLTKNDFMRMIQEGVRLGISKKASNNRVRQIRQGREPESRSILRLSHNPSALDIVGGKKMKYILHQYKPKNFELIRRLHGVSNDDFIGSICDSELVGGYTESSGKSGSLFWSSFDGKYIMKSICHQESIFLNNICSAYLRYIRSHPHTLLCKFFGMFKIVTSVAQPSYIRGGQRASRVRSQFVQTTRFVIMQNVFSNQCGLEKFDLKGTTEDRFVRAVSGNEVLKDINFTNRWITLPEHLSECLNRVIHEDCEFLFKHGIMDYSLIVGIKQVSEPAEAWERLTSANVHIPSPVGKKKTLADKLNEQLLAAKLAAVKAAHSVQKLLKRDDQEIVPPGGQDSRFSSVDDGIPEERSPRHRDPEPLPCIFQTFNGGVVGIDETKSFPVVYYFGIIDMLQQYTIKKKMAHFVKKFTIGCCHEIDTVAPKYYHQRFEKYIAQKIKSIDIEELEQLHDQHINQQYLSEE